MADWMPRWSAMTPRVEVGWWALKERGVCIQRRVVVSCGVYNRTSDDMLVSKVVLCMLVYVSSAAQRSFRSVVCGCMRRSTGSLLVEEDAVAKVGQRRTACSRSMSALYVVLSRVLRLLRGGRRDGRERGDRPRTSTRTVDTR